VVFDQNRTAVNAMAANNTKWTFMMDAATALRGQQEPYRRPDACVLVVFGVGGDLTKRLLLPALYNLASFRLLPERFGVIGVARKAQSETEFRSAMDEALRQFATTSIDPALASQLVSSLLYVKGDFHDPATYEGLASRLDAFRRERGIPDHYIFYLATPPDQFAVIAEQLGRAGLAEERDGTWRRLVVEKPFGTDLASAQQLNERLRAVFDEHQIYRIDHYLGKETVQNIMALRFANGLFEPLWNRNHIDHVQITVAETVSVEARGKFYDHVGALRDMVPNHLFQLLSLTAMEPPNAFEADAVRTEKEKAIEAIHPLTSEECLTNVVRGQYVAGRVLDQPVGAYRDAPGVNGNSTTETYVAMRLNIDNWRWAGVPFYLRTGKALAARRTEIAIRFKHAPFALFRDTPVERLAQNLLVLRIQPDEGASLQFNAKIPGPTIRIGGVRMDFKYKDYFDAAPSTGYETLIYDCMLGDATLFMRADNIEAGWRVVQPILDAWQAGRRQLVAYAAGSEGPSAADELLTRSGRSWHEIV
jgi:glucose-6-phosphate 1-dehydrogenase